MAYLWLTHHFKSKVRVDWWFKEVLEEQFVEVVQNQVVSVEEFDDEEGLNVERLQSFQGGQGVWMG